MAIAVGPIRRHSLGKWTQKSKFNAPKGTHGRVVEHSGAPITVRVQMCPKMTPHSKVLVCTYYGDGRGGGQTRQQAAGGGRRSEE